MTQPDDPRSRTVTVSVNLKLADARVQAEFTVPTEPFDLGKMLPIFRGFAEEIVGQAVETARSQGHAVSCRSGCGACCRQLVPITEIEARVLFDVVEALPEPRRSLIRERFAEALRRLEAAGLLEKLVHPEQFSDDELRPFSLEYFGAGIPCPFLEDESCSIYEERPIACREYLVTSPAEHCARPSAETVQCVPLPAKVSTAVSRIGEDGTRRFIRWVPLILALNWAPGHPDDLGLRPGPDWLREFFERLSGRELPPQSPSSGGEGNSAT